MAEQPTQPQPVTPETQLPEGEEDLQERINGFNTELMPLLGKFELGLAAVPRFSADGRVVADPIVVSVRKKEGQEAVEKPAEAAAPDAGLAKVE